jgi:FkbM family methyltransferase
MRFLQEAFCAVGGIASRLPQVRGRTRPFLLLFKLLGLARLHTIVDSTLLNPVRYRARLDLHSWLQRIAFLTGGYEGDTVRFLSRLYDCHPRRGVFFDIGANVGLVAIPFSKMREGASVCAFEAVADNFEALRHNIELNQLNARIAAFCVALGDERKSVEIQVEGDLGVGEGTGTANIMADGSTWPCVRIPLQLRTLDDLVAAGEIPSNVALIKIDTDGYDLKILQGGRSLLENARPVIFGEFAAHCMNWHGQTVGNVQDLARRYGYEVWGKKPGQWFFSEKIDGGKYTIDLLMVPGELKARYQWCLSH